MRTKIKVGISKCLLGVPVRYDGQHKRDRYLKDILGQFIDWVPVCPEVECGLPTPREAMRLEGDPDKPRLVTSKTGKDLTSQMQSWIQKELKLLAKEQLCGFVFKKGSPSSGMQGVKIYNEQGNPYRRGSGMFARAFMERFPLLPAEDEGRLHDDKLRENFVERIFVYSRWQKFCLKDPSIKGLVDFHAKHKLTLMSHSPKLLKEMGKLVANAKSRKLKKVLNEYEVTLMTSLRLIATVKKNVNVLYHILGYFKKSLSAEEKQEMVEIIEEYHRELVPLIVPVTLFQHYVRKYRVKYLREQFYLNPPPAELKLKNHV